MEEQTILLVKILFFRGPITFVTYYVRSTITGTQTLLSILVLCRFCHYVS